MNTLTLLMVLLVVSFCMVEVYSRHVLDDISDPESLSLDHSDGVRKHASDRHRRRRWQNYGGYDYPVPPPYPYYPERRDYDRNQQDLLPQIVKLLEEISVYVKRPPPAPQIPQPIYIPYPVPYPIAQYSPCSANGTNKPSIHTRFPQMEDTNQNWGFVIPKDDDGDDYIDGSRPISFEPIKPIRPMKRPTPSVEHGSSDGGSQAPSTEAPKYNQPGSLRTPSVCNAAILSCCVGDKQQQKTCFNSFGCGVSYDDGAACSEESISSALDSFKAAYSPVQ